MVKVKIDDDFRFAEVQFYVYDSISETAYAVLKMYSKPDQAILVESIGTLQACEYLGSKEVKVIEVKKIISVVSMQPLPHRDGEANLWFVVEKPEFYDADITGYEDEDLYNQ
ncbi:hypothetical protein VKT23_014771 [Stygiomarasmius scandens]|uniref:Uncharacterized protein n=1 Tax=Marasmiellus scandens TaxID=2682957 RepID=A0ABR1J296_9AGAR